VSLLIREISGHKETLWEMGSDILLIPKLMYDAGIEKEGDHFQH
jgi:hypothetical protein